MALKKIEISDQLLEKLGANKSPKELGEVVEYYTKTGFECASFPSEAISLLNIAFDISKRLNKEQEVAEMLKNAIKDINLKVMSEL